MERLFLGIGGVFGFLAVALGAFAAHGLKGKLDAGQLDVFHTGVQYQMYHGLALLLTAMLLMRMESSWLIVAGWCFIAGVVLFSGSLYALALTGAKLFGPITPIGGVLFLVGWVCLVVGAVA
ncbi:MAG: DUF423 domain-containing protein [Alicyclobacillaceae bacterium]|nr:DUF423 domain-containing protein [Alicyclobacillaceae bacterium]